MSEDTTVIYHVNGIRDDNNLYNLRKVPMNRCNKKVRIRA